MYIIYIPMFPNIDAHKNIMKCIQFAYLQYCKSKTFQAVPVLNKQY